MIGSSTDSAPAPRGPIPVAAGIWGAWSFLLPLAGSAILIANLETVRPFLKDVAGPSGFAALFAITCGLALLPTYFQAALAGFVFGLSSGAAVALTGFLGGSIIGYVLSRLISGERILELIRARPKWNAVRSALVGEDRGFWPTFAIVSLLRLPPNSPFALTNMIFASVRIRPLVFLTGTLIGMTPRTVLAVWIGTNLGQLSSTQDVASATPKWVFWAGIAVTLLVLICLSSIANRAIRRFVPTE